MSILLFSIRTCCLFTSADSVKQKKMMWLCYLSFIDSCYILCLSEVWKEWLLLWVKTADYLVRTSARTRQWAVTSRPVCGSLTMPAWRQKWNSSSVLSKNSRQNLVGNSKLVHCRLWLNVWLGSLVVELCIIDQEVAGKSPTALSSMALGKPLTHTCLCHTKRYSLVLRN